jgi:hypothetical protein
MVLLYPTGHLSGGDILSSSLPPLPSKGSEGTKKRGGRSTWVCPPF